MTPMEKTGKENMSVHGVSMQAGFTLIEVLIAITILSVGLLAIASMQISAIQTTGQAKFISKETMMAEERLEYLSLLPYSSDPELVAGVDKADPLTTPSGYTINYTVVDNMPRANCKQVTVSVQWTDRGMKKTTTLTGVKPQL